MPIEFSCDKCQKTFSVDDTAGGKQGRCSDCGHLNAIPDSTATSIFMGPDTYEVTSAVNGAVFGPADRTTLDRWLEEGRITPNCQIKVAGTERWKPANEVFPQLNDAASGTGRQAVESADIVDATVLADAEPFSRFTTGTTRNAYSAVAASTVTNPYAAGTTAEKQIHVGDKIVPTSGDIGFIISRGFDTYSGNFGLVVGGFLVFLAALLGLVLVAGFFSVIGEVGALIGGVVLMLGSIFVAAGFVKLCLKVGRGEKTGLDEMFSAGDRVLPLCGYIVLLAGMFIFPFVLVGLVIAVLVEVVGQEAIGIAMVLFALTYVFEMILGMFVWPGALLVIDGKTTVFRSIPVGFHIAKKNLLQFLVVYIVAVLVTWLGLLAIGFGVLVTAPIGIMIVMCAYLNMTGQIRE